MNMVSALLLFRAIRPAGDIIATAPSMTAIDRGQFDLSFRMLFAALDRPALDRIMADQALESYDIKECGVYE